MTKARDLSLAAKAPLASPVFTGNVGVGVTPEAWQSGWSALQIGGLTSYYAPTTTNASQSLMINNNAYNDGAWKYLITDEASSYYQLHGGHTFRVAPSGTADAAISWNTAMTINNAGIVTKPLQPAFDAYSNQSSYSSGNTVASLNLDSTRLNVGGHYNTSNDRFTAPVAGVYKFNYRTIHNGAVSNAHVRMYKNGSTLSGSDSHYSAATGTAWSVWTTQAIILLAANDYVSISHNPSASIHGGNYQSFNGYLLG